MQKVNNIELQIELNAQSIVLRFLCQEPCCKQGIAVELKENSWKIFIKCANKKLRKHKRKTYKQESSF